MPFNDPKVTKRIILFRWKPPATFLASILIFCTSSLQWSCYGLFSNSFKLKPQNKASNKWRDFRPLNWSGPGPSVLLWSLPFKFYHVKVIWLQSRMEMAISTIQTCGFQVGDADRFQSRMVISKGLICRFFLQEQSRELENLLNQRREITRETNDWKGFNEAFNAAMNLQKFCFRKSPVSFEAQVFSIFSR